MAAVVVDANVLIAARLSRDANHDRGEPIVQAIDQGELPTAAIPGDALQEIINYLQARAGHDVATETLDAIIESSGFSIIQTSKSDFTTGRSLFQRHEPLSLTDAIIVATMRRNGQEYLYSFDDGFDRVDGITRLTTADSPFER